MWLHGVQTRRAGDPEKETGEHVELSVIPGMKFEKELARKNAGMDFSWAIREADPTPAAAQDAGETETAPRSSSGKRVKYVCTAKDCKTSVLGRSGQNLACLDHGEPVSLTITG